MLISYSHNFIFLHVAKVAGTSIRDALDGYTQLPEKFKIKRPPMQIDGKPNKLYTMWENALSHATAQAVKKELTADVYNSFYKFAFVRNPWDWQVSMYHFILKQTDHVRHDLVKSMSGFDEYIEWVISEKNPYPRGATKYQKDMLIDKQGNLLVDYIGRYEMLNRDFDHVCQKLKLDTSLPTLNQSHHRDYRSYYDAKTRRQVATSFCEDIEMFDYTFDG